MMEIGVAVDEAVVRLTGTVTSRSERLAVQETVLHVAGVRDVRNDIQVQDSTARLPERPRRTSRPR